MELVFFIVYKTASGLTYSKIDAIKYHRGLNDLSAEQFAAWSADQLFAHYHGVENVHVTVVDCGMTVTRKVIRFVMNADLRRNPSQIEQYIIGELVYNRADMERGDES